MQVHVKNDFDQLLKLVKELPSGKLKAEIEKNALESKTNTDLETVLLNGPVATKQQLATIKKNRKAIKQWRTKPF